MKESFSLSVLLSKSNIVSFLLLGWSCVLMSLLEAGGVGPGVPGPWMLSPVRLPVVAPALADSRVHALHPPSSGRSASGRAVEAGRRERRALHSVSGRGNLTGVFSEVLSLLFSSRRSVVIELSDCWLPVLMFHLIR